ncbi:MAG: hypothetical protein AB8G77_11160 [Rhodothermales bacterium]
MEAAENKDKEPTTPEDKPAKAAGGAVVDATPSSTGLKGTRSLRKLRDRVERAANELIRLREENAALQDRIEELESTPASNGKDAGLLMLETDPEALKRKVEGFIQSIDNYLDKKEPSQ